MISLKKLTFISTTLLLIHSTLLAQGSLEVTSERADFGIDKINLNLELRNADLDEPLRNVTLTIADSLGNQIFQESEISGQKNLVLEINQIYNINVSDAEFEDTTFVIDAVTDRTINQNLTILLNPKKVKVQYNITDFDTGDALDNATEIIFTNKNRDERLEYKLNNQGDNFIVDLYSNDSYEVSINKEGYFFAVDEIKASTIEDKSTALQEVKLVSLSVGNKIAMENITFEPQSVVLNEQVKQELERVVKLMNDNPTLHLQVAGHTDDVGTEAENFSLSQRRVDSVIEYLTSKKIDANRLQGKGFGESQPLISNDTPENRAKNRRFELIVLQI